MRIVRNDTGAGARVPTLVDPVHRRDLCFARVASLRRHAASIFLLECADRKIHSTCWHFAHL